MSISILQQRPVQQLLAQNPSTPGSQPSGLSNVLKKAAIFGGVGAVAGLGASLLGLPVIGGIAAPIAAAIGGAIGALGGAIFGIIQNHRNHPSPPAAQVGPSTPPPPPPSINTSS